MALIPEDRKTEGLMLPMSVRDNLSFAALDRLSHGGIIDRAAERKAIDEMIKLLAIRTAGTDIPVGALSGGNQQKVVIAKWLMVSPRIILLNDPTRGIDVGTKQEIYQLLRKLADAGAAILFYSTDYDELIGCCDRVLVLYDGAHQARAGRRRDHRAGADRAARSTSRRGEAGVKPAVERMKDWRYLVRRAARHAAGARRSSSLMFAIYVGNHPAGLHRQRRADRGQQGRAARPRRHGADAGRASPPASTCRSA